MKKILVMLAIALIVSGSVWAQSFVNFPDLPDFSAVQTSSVEKEYSAGLFDSDVDNYIDPTFFDGQIGTFMFAGGFHGGYGGPSFNNRYANPFAFPTAGTSDTVSLGFAKSLGTDKYLAAYYGGNFVTAYGFKKPAGKYWGTDWIDDDNDPLTPDVEVPALVEDKVGSAQSDSIWRNKLAVLFGLGAMGFRFDLIMDDTAEHTEKLDKTSAQTIESAPTIALSWGTIINDKIAPWVKLGFKFPDTTVVTSTTQDGKVDKKATKQEDAIFLFNAGASIDLNETSSFSADLNVLGAFADSYKGDKDAVPLLTGYTPNPDDPNKDVGAPYTAAGGSFAVTLDADYTKALTFGDNTTVKLKPNLGVRFGTQSTNDSRAKDKSPSNDVFILGAGIDVGGEYAFEKIALYTGLGLRFFEWTAYGHSGGKEKDKSTNYTFRGLAWDNDAFGNDPAAATLRFGVTFTPIEGLVFGAGLGANVPTFNPVTMSVGASQQNGYPTFWTSGVASITVSYKFANKPKEEGSAE